MEQTIMNLEPKEVIKFFAEICKIPHGSFDEKRISDYLTKFATERGLWVYRDKELNVYIKKDGSKGFEHCEPVVFQGHMDMVCEKEFDSNHDFTKDGLNLKTDGEYLFADKTTLGADDGIAVAIMLALLDSKTIKHPPLECLITTKEEVGLEGAFAIESDKISARKMINIDTEEEGVLLASCAGGLNVDVVKELSYVDADGCEMTLTINGLKGGHSGIDIDKERANASKVMARILSNILDKVPFNLAKIMGGTKDNAITRDCCATIFVKKQDKENFINEFENQVSTIKDELKITDPNFNAVISDTNQLGKMLDEKNTYEVINLIYTLPSTVMSRSIEIADFVVSSLNMGIVAMENDSLKITFMIRSSVETLKYEIAHGLSVVAKCFGATAITTGGYSGWNFQSVSPLRDTMVKVYKEIFGKELKVEAVHAGLECGIIKSKFPDMDIVAIGPDIVDCHTPGERMSIESLERLWKLILETLDELCK
ncbi:MAG: aminoacyl-histidine dipeptidase [Oscillospiraceae bacterium]